MTVKLFADLLVIAAYFAGVTGIGIYFSRRSKDTSDFALGGRSIPWWAVLASILAAEISAGTFFGAPGEGFKTRNFTYAQLMVGTQSRDPLARERVMRKTMLASRRVRGPKRFSRNS